MSHNHEHYWTPKIKQAFRDMAEQKFKSGNESIDVSGAQAAAQILTDDLFQSMLFHLMTTGNRNFQSP